MIKWDFLRLVDGPIFKYVATGSPILGHEIEIFSPNQHASFAAKTDKTVPMYTTDLQV